MGAELFHAMADRRTNGHDEANNRFSQFCERAKNRWEIYSVKYLAEVVYLLSANTACCGHYTEVEV
jgi:hypothetical protein